MSFDPAVLQPNPTVRGKILAVLQAALAAVDPAEAVRAALIREGNRLHVAGHTLDLSHYRRVLVVGAGKAGAPMAQAVEEILGQRITQGLVVVKHGHGGPTERVPIVEAGHPVPDEAGAAAGAEILALAQDAGPDDLVIALLSGGGSALLVSPAQGVSLDDIQAMTGELLACGATINEINCLRKHVSAVKGGQLARAAHPATLLTLVLSDVVGSPLDVIASGPTVPDATTWADAWSIVERYQLAEALPPAIRARLEAGRRGDLPETPKADDPAFAGGHTVVIGDNRLAARAALQSAHALGYTPLLLSTFVEGPAAEIARLAVGMAREVRAGGHPVAAPACIVLGGETTVELGPNPGKGGRNQELALAAALAMDTAYDHLPGVTIVSLATDGTDGPTDSAGGMADRETVARGRQAGLDARTHLVHHDAYPFLQATHDLLQSGPTQTNVNDLIFVFVE